MRMIVDKMVECAWFVWELVVASVIRVAFIALLITMFAIGFNCGLDDQCVERIYMVVDAAKG